ncbi:MAG: hypothetical protein KKH98_08710 [Spirochaetes bacterium]|nr:hypothetical protein [Spirochaetota bacterium]
MSLKKIIIIFIILFFYLNSAFTQETKDNNNEAEGKPFTGLKIKGFPFHVYYDALHDDINHFYPSGWRGDWSDIKFNGTYQKNPKEGKYCIQIKYTANQNQKFGWASVSWQNPAHNWGGIKGGYDLRGAKKFYFYARGEEGNEYAEFKIGGISGLFSDSIPMLSTGNVVLTKEWKLYEIDLLDVDLSYISGGLTVVFTKSYNPDGCTIYIDEAYYTDKIKIMVNNQVRLPIIKKNSIMKVAIMDFENTSNSKDLNYLSKVISESISTSLGKNNDLIVMDSKGVKNNLKKLALTFENFKTLNEDTVLGKILGVDIVVRGSFIEVDNQILINIKLIEVASGTILTADQIKGQPGKDLFLLLDKTSNYILSQLLRFNRAMN